MREQKTDTPPSTEIEFDFKNALILFGILLLAVIVGVGGLAITGLNQQAQTPTGSQTVPSSK